MQIWAIADLHLCLGAPEKNMDHFGQRWSNYMERIEYNWCEVVQEEDLVLIPGDISWALKLDDALLDLEWIDRLPGTKVMIRGNHDYWWSSPSKVRTVLPPSLHIIQNDTFHQGELGVAGTRFWDSPEYDFSAEVNGSFKVGQIEEKIYKRELHRLELSLQQLGEKAQVRLAMTHYPPIGTDLASSAASLLFEKYGIQKVLFGHLHNLREGLQLFGQREEIEYILTAADYLNFHPKKICSI